MKKTIVILANPFGYGPVGKALAVANIFQKTLTRDEIIFAGKGLCLELASRHSIRYEEVDQRNESELVSFLKKHRNVYVFSSQNRFAIKAAKQLQLPTAFLDGLAWFWKEIPEDHFLADITFWLNYPNLRQKKLPIKDIHTIGAILGDLPKKQAPKHILLHLGGGENPLTHSLPENYLNLIGKALNDSPSFPSPLIIATGKQMASHLSALVRRKDVKIQSFPRDEFLENLSEAKQFITTAGQTATLEAFALGIPTSFLLSTNMSQIALVNLLTKHSAAPVAQSWTDYKVLDPNFYNLNEKEALIELDTFAKEIYQDSARYNRYYQNFQQILNTEAERALQSHFINNLGRNGAQDCVTILMKKWDLV